MFALITDNEVGIKYLALDALRSNTHDQDDLVHTALILIIADQLKFNLIIILTPDDVVIGVAVLTPRRRIHIFVKEEYRRRGFGSLLVDAMVIRSGLPRSKITSIPTTDEKILSFWNKNKIKLKDSKEDQSLIELRKNTVTDYFLKDQASDDSFFVMGDLEKEPTIQ